VIQEEKQGRPEKKIVKLGGKKGFLEESVGKKAIPSRNRDSRIRT